MNLAQALRLSRNEQPEGFALAIAGAGGKTTALFQLARQLAQQQTESLQFPVLVTTTTHLATHQLALADRLFSLPEPLDMRAVENGLSPGANLVTTPPGGAGRAAGPAPHSLLQLYNLAQRRHLPLLIEADGSRQRPLKAPAEHEPAIPGFVERVLVVAGLSALGKPLADAWVHRPERFAALAGLQPGEAISPEGLRRLLLSESGGLKNIPAGAQRTVLLNQVDTPELRLQAGALARSLLGAYDAALVASLGEQGEVFAAYEPVAGVVLAAGEGRRFHTPGGPGRSKLLLSWRGQPLVRHAARAALDGGLAPVVVVTGAYAAEIEEALHDLPVILAHNPDWQSGQSTTLHTGLRHLPAQAGAAVFLLADQPQVPSVLVRALVEAHAATLNSLAAPRVKGRRANPVLFDSRTFPALFALSGDTGGRPLFADPQRYPVDWVEWEDERILLDVDTESDYRVLESLPEEKR